MKMRKTINKLLKYFSLLYQCYKGLSFFDDISCQLFRIATADVPHRVDCLGGDEYYLACFSSHGSHAFNKIFQRTFEHINYLFSWMLMFWRRFSGPDSDHHLQHLSPRCAQIMALELDSIIAHLRKGCGWECHCRQSNYRNCTGDNIFILFHCVFSRTSICSLPGVLLPVTTGPLTHLFGYSKLFKKELAWSTNNFGYSKKEPCAVSG